MTSKRQVTLPKELADAYGIEPGDEIDWEPAGDALRVLPRKRLRPNLTVQERLALFDEGVRRHEERWAGTCPSPAGAADRGWTREELYGRGRTD